MKKTIPLQQRLHLVGRLSFFFLSSVVLSVFPIYPSANAQSLGSVTIEKFDGTSLTATLDSIDENGKLSGKQIPADLSLGDILTIKTANKSSQIPTDSIIVRLANGGQLSIRDPRITAETLSFQSNSGLSKISLQSVRAIVWSTAPEIDTAIAKPSADEDTVFVQTNDGLRALSGVIEGLDGEQLQINYQNESRKIGRDKIKAIVMADLGLPKPAGLAATLTLTDGSNIIGVIKEMNAGTLTLQLAGSNTLDIDVTYLSSFSIRSDRLLFLSDIDPVSVDQRTEFALQRPWQKDRSIENHPLTLRMGKSETITEFRKGLGTQAFTELVFENDSFDRFMATVGIDTETRGRGDCEVVVRGDSIKLWSGRIAGNGLPVDLDLDITGMKKIALVVYPGNDFDLADHCNWVNARFARTK